MDAAYNGLTAMFALATVVVAFLGLSNGFDNTVDKKAPRKPTALFAVAAPVFLGFAVFFGSL